MTERIATSDPNIPISEVRIARGIEVVNLLNRERNQTWGDYVTATVDLFEVTQEIFDDAMNEQMSRLTLLLPDLQITEGLQSAELPELKRAAVVGIQRALLVRRASMNLSPLP